MPIKGVYPMQANSSERLTLIIIVGITAIGCVVWLGAQFFVWLFLQAVGVSTDLWAMVEA